MTRPRKGGRKILIKERELLSHICDLVVPHYSCSTRALMGSTELAPTLPEVMGQRGRRPIEIE